MAEAAKDENDRRVEEGEVEEEKEMEEGSPRPAAEEYGVSERTVEMLERVADPETVRRFLEWKKRKESRHPLYRSSGQDYGYLPPGYRLRLEPPRHPKKGTFTKQFGNTGTYVEGGLRTGVTRHRYLPEYDGVL